MNLTRIIHQTWKSDDIPEEIYFSAWRQTWREQNPDWQYCFWTDEDNASFIDRHYPRFSAFYHSIKRGVIRSDVARALYLHYFGGLYVDMDFVCLKPMDELVIGDRINLAYQASPQALIPNAWMYSPPRENFWLHFIYTAVAAHAKMGEDTPENIAGPNRLRRFYSLLPESEQKKIIIHSAYPKALIYPVVWSDPASVAKAGSLNWRDVEKIAAAYPYSYAATPWRHNW